jgi:GNAT superfamily N-acetyltransferase
MSVAGSRKRRQFPRHVLGIGYRRPLGHDPAQLVDEDDGRLFGALFRAFLGLETETTAAAYERLYHDLVGFVADCLKASTDLYVGGVRRVSAKDFTSRSWYLATLIDQNARSYARRCLHLSQRSADSYSEADPWTPILRRTRQRIVQAESRRRNALRAALKSAISVAAGLSESNEHLSRGDFVRALSENSTQLAYILERDFEVRLPGQPAFFKEHAKDSFETFLSAFQRQLDSISGDADVTIIVEATRQEYAQDSLAKAYDEYLVGPRAQEEDKVRLQHRSQFSTTFRAFRARSLGETVGLMWVQPTKSALRLLDLFVAEHMRGSRVAQLLIRRAIEMADTQVEIRRDSVPAGRIAWFEDMGFHSDAQNQRTSSLCYVLFKLEERESSESISFEMMPRGLHKPGRHEDGNHRPARHGAARARARVPRSR